MGISNYKPNSRLAQAGVVPNAAARPASPYEGQVIFQLDTKRTLVWDGVGWVDLSTGTVNQPGLELVTSCTATFTGGTAGSVSNGVVTIGSANTSIAVANAFSTNYEAYKIVVSGGVGSTSAVLNFTLGSSSTGYYRSAVGYRYDNVAAIQGGAANASSFVSGFMTTVGLSMILDVVNPALTQRTMFAGGYGEFRSVSGSGGVHVQGFHDVATAYTGFSIAANSGNITGGTIRVYGYRN
jgi:hypothetical protein